MNKTKFDLWFDKEYPASMWFASRWSNGMLLMRDVFREIAEKAYCQGVNDTFEQLRENNE